jgi:hypothetical protein
MGLAVLFAGRRMTTAIWLGVAIVVTVVILWLIIVERGGNDE